MLTAEYAAGFFDGEGSVCLVRKTGTKGRGGISWRLDVCVGQLDPRPLLALKATWGGTVRGPRPRTGHYEWKCHARQLDAFLRAIQPHVIVKADVIALALEFRDGIRPWGGNKLGLSCGEIERRQAIHRRIRECNRKGKRFVLDLAAAA